MKRLAIITRDIYFYGGAERYAIQLSNYLIKYFDYEITLFSQNSTSKKRIQKNQIKKMTTAHLKFYKGLPIPIIKEKYPISLKLNKYDVIYDINRGIFTSFYLILFSKIFKKKLIYGLHDPYIFHNMERTYKKYNRIKQVLSKFYYTLRIFITLRYPEIHTLNKDDKKTLQTVGYTGKINLIPNFLYSDSIKKTTTKKNKKFTLLFVGRLNVTHKGLDLLEGIFNRLLKEHIQIDLRICGSGEDGKKIISNLIKKYPKNIKWLGFLNTESLNNEYKNADLFILTSRNESFSLVVLEAQSYGLPVVSFNIKGPRDIITDSIQGRLVKKFSIDEFVIQILYYYKLWLNNYKKYIYTKNMIIKEINGRYNSSVIIPKIDKMLKSTI